MSFYDFAASPVWWLLCGAAWLFIAVDIQRRLDKRVVVMLIALLVLAGVGLQAAMVPREDWCGRLGDSWWTWLGGCW